MKTNTLWRGLLALILIAGSLLSTSPVKALGTPQIVGINPSSSAPVGTTVSIHATVQWDSDFRSMRICFRDENWCQEEGTPDFSKNFDTSGMSAGTYTIIVEVAAVDKGWDTANKTYGSYELTGSSQPPTPVPPPAPSKGPNISIFDFSPSSANVGDPVTIHIKVDSSNPGATKLTVSCGSLIKNETAEVEFNTIWNTSGCPAGTASVNVLSRDVNDLNWANPSSATRQYGLSAPPVPVPSPTANFWADSNSILQGQCTNLHWDTSDAVSVDIDGSGVNASGSKQVCPSVTQKFTLTAYAGSGGSNAYRNLTVTVTAVQQPQAVIDSFHTGNVISIGGNIYVIVDGRRRHVPNPATLDALGIGQNLINNKGFSDSQLSQIIQGPDIPDVNIDPTGVASFRAAYLPNLNPIVPNPPTPVPTAVPQVVQPPAQPTAVPPVQPTAVPLQPPASPNTVPVQPTGQENTQSVDRVEGTVLAQCPAKPAQPPSLIPEAHAGDNRFNQGECTWYVFDQRPDAAFWLPSSGADAYSWIKAAQDADLRVDNSPVQGDIAVWQKSCGGPYSAAGHVAYVTLVFVFSNETWIKVNEYNWNGDHLPHMGSSYKVKSCMMFIHQPANSQIDSAIPQKSLWDQFVDWVLNIFK